MDRLGGPRLRVVLQRVSEAVVRVDDAIHAEIGPGLVALAGFAPGDGPQDLVWMADKIGSLRIFPDAEGKMNLSVADVGGGVLVIPNFTLYGDCRKGRRPGFSGAAAPDVAEALLGQFCETLGGSVPVHSGVFGAHMHVALTNDGPVTLLLDTDKTF